MDLSQYGSNVDVFNCTFKKNHLYGYSVKTRNVVNIARCPINITLLLFQVSA